MKEAKIMFADYEVVKLRHDLPEHGMKAGTHGTIVMVHHAPRYLLMVLAFAGDSTITKFFAIILFRKF